MVLTLMEAFMKTQIIPSLLLGLCLTACVGYNVRYDYDARANYTTYKTFDWYAASKLAKDNDKASEPENPIMERRVKAAVERELEARGYKREAASDPDFLVTYYPTYQDRSYRTSTHVGWGWGFRPFMGIGTSLSEVHHYKEGTLVLEIVDFKTNQRVWQAAAEGALTDLRNPEDADEVVGRAVRQMLERFPPPRKESVQE